MAPELLAIAVAGWTATGVVAFTAWRRLVLTARACHEVRGPLTAAFLALDVMGRRGEAPQERIAGLDEQLRRARLALDDLSAARRGHVAAERQEPVGVAAVLARVEATWSPVAAARGRELSVEVTATGHVLADRVRLAQAIGNLIANALDHGSGAVTVRARVVGCRVRIEVGDGGSGLAEPLGVLLRRARGRLGRRGHGLAVAAGIAARIGGELVCAPSAAGAAMALDLPLLAAEAAA